MAVHFYIKDPDESLDYAIDWSGPNGLDPGDTITGSTWTALDVGMTVGTVSFTATKTTVWPVGGVLGQEFRFLNRVTTAQNRSLDQTVVFLCEDK